MQTGEERVHTTFNLSTRLIKEARRLFKDKSKTEIIHEALSRLIQMERFRHHVTKWSGKGHFKSHG